MTRRLLATCLLALALPVAAQSTPFANFTDMWWNPAESGWGVSFIQHAGTNQSYAVWYTYDPREADPYGERKPLWIVMSGGTWTSPSTITGPVYVLDGMPFYMQGSNRTITEVGRFTFTFSDANNATFHYEIAAPQGVPSSDPAYNLPAMSGTKQITRTNF